jgi:hypothetical protein
VLGLEHAGDQSGYLYAVSQQGRIYRFDQNSSNPVAEIWLDITDRLVSGGERGLLGLAFHPEFTDNGKFYVNYTAPARCAPLFLPLKQTLIPVMHFLIPKPFCWFSTSHFQTTMAVI